MNTITIERRLNARVARDRRRTGAPLVVLESAEREALAAKDAAFALLATEEWQREDAVNGRR